MKVKFIFIPLLHYSQCFLATSSHGLYLHLPVSVFMLANLCLFLATTTTLHRYSVSTSIARWLYFYRIFKNIHRIFKNIYRIFTKYLQVVPLQPHPAEPLPGQQEAGLHGPICELLCPEHTLSLHNLLACALLEIIYNHNHHI